MAIRIAREADIPAILDIYRPYVENTAVSFEYTAPSLEEFTARFWGFAKQFPWLVWEEAGEILGYAYAQPPFEREAFSWCAEPSIYLKEAALRQGIGSRLYEALEAILGYQGYEMLYALITTENPGSIAFHRARGYRTVGVLENCGIKFSPLLLNVIKDPVQIIEYAQICPDHLCGCAQTFEFTQKGCRLFRARTVVEDQFCSGFCKDPGDASADALARAGNKDFFPSHFRNSGSIIL